MSLYAIHDETTIVNIIVANSIEDAFLSNPGFNAFDLEDFSVEEQMVDGEGNLIFNEETGEAETIKKYPKIGWAKTTNGWEPLDEGQN